MKQWYYCTFTDAQGDFREWKIIRCKPEFLQDELDDYVKFSGTVKAGFGFLINERTGKPTFTKVVAQATLPF